MNKKYFIIPVLLFVVFAAVYLYTKKPNIEPNMNSNTGSSVSTDSTQTNNQSSYQSNLTLELTSPKDGSTVTSPTISVTGKTSADADVFVNDKELKADSSGNFSTTITLDEGQNSIVVVANDTNGNSAEKQVNVILESTQ